MGCGVQLSAQPSICIYIYSQTGTFIYPEPPNTLKNCLNYEHYVVNYLFYGDLEGLGYICVSAWKKICPWRHSNC